MGKQSLMAAAAASTGAYLLSSSAFSLGQQISARPAAPQQLRGQSSAQAPAGQSTSFSCAALGAVGVAAGVAAVSRGRTTRKAQPGLYDVVQEGGELVVKRKEESGLSGPFAGGLVGSKHHGWGEYQWDPAGLATRFPEHLPWYREAELKHGRVAMLAFVGLIVPDFVRIPVEQCQNPDLDMLTAHNELIGPGLGEGPMWWLLIFCSVIESFRFKSLGLAFENLTLENAGDLDFGKGFLPKTPEGIELMKTKELKNGRLAMLAVSGIFTGGITWDSHHFPWVPASTGW
eukprot:TRINITY_DN4988_c0_g1_i13.p1 TRINITY_DN4988_c0_g1~~TRINITY_DN4988_c0_g1_i13.p1  ORF type:complete len:288 (+),score=77.67 TRINITY_DN4988_c0_g1_i13:92-955(+)